MVGRRQALRARLLESRGISGGAEKCEDFFNISRLWLPVGPPRRRECRLFAGCVSRSGHLRAAAQRPFGTTARCDGISVPLAWGGDSYQAPTL